VPEGVNSEYQSLLERFLKVDMVAFVEENRRVIDRIIWRGGIACSLQDPIDRGLDLVLYRLSAG